MVAIASAQAKISYKPNNCNQLSPTLVKKKTNK